jgi:repressor LexA
LTFALISRISGRGEIATKVGRHGARRAEPEIGNPETAIAPDDGCLITSSPNLPDRRCRVALTRRQREIYDFICQFVEDNGYSPSLEEIGAHFRLASVATVHKHIQHLVSKGFLRKAWNRSRSLEPVPEEGSDLPDVPILGTVAAGLPIEAIEDGSESVKVPAQMMGRPGETYALRVRGDSMIEDQICDGDVVIVESRPEARNGETVVALVGGREATLKRFYRKGAQVRLVPANSSMEPIELPAAEVQIRGVVRGLVRTY